MVFESFGQPPIVRAAAFFWITNFVCWLVLGAPCFGCACGTRDDFFFKEKLDQLGPFMKAEEVHWGPAQIERRMAAFFFTETR